MKCEKGVKDISTSIEYSTGRRTMVPQPATRTLWIYKVVCTDEDFPETFVGYTTIPYEQVLWALENICPCAPRPQHFEEFELDEQFCDFIYHRGGGVYWDVHELQVQEVSRIPDNIELEVQEWAEREGSSTQSIFKHTG